MPRGGSCTRFRTRSDFVMVVVTARRRMDTHRDAGGCQNPQREVGVSPASSARPRDRTIGWGLLLLLTGIYAILAGGHLYSTDEETMFAATQSLVDRRDVALGVNDGNLALLAARGGREGVLVAGTGIGQSLAGVPFYLAGTAFAALTAVGPSWVEFTQRVFIGWTNSLVTAVGVVLLYLIARTLGARWAHAVALALVYGLATMVLPHAKTFLSEPLATTLALAATLFALRAGRDGALRDVAISGAFAGLGLFARTTSAIFAPVILAYVLWRWRRREQASLRRRWSTVVAAFGGGSALPLLLYGLANWWRYGSPFDLGYQVVSLDFPVLDGLRGLFLSPGKSLFLYAPVALLGLVAAPFVRRARRAEVAMLLGLGLGNALLFARFPHWHGDHAWGPRYLVMSLPFLALPAAMLLRRTPWRRALALSAVLGIPAALLATVMSFNAYFYIVNKSIDPAAPPEVTSEVARHDPNWSPLLGHARALPDLLQVTVESLQGGSARIEPFPATPTARFIWYSRPPQLDLWAYWLFPTGGPRSLLVMLPLFAAMAAIGGWMVLRGLAAARPGGAAVGAEGPPRVTGSADAPVTPAPRAHPGDA